jgi:polyhydroxybutyrate depolymerase
METPEGAGGQCRQVKRGSRFVNRIASWPLEGQMNQNLKTGLALAALLLAAVPSGAAGGRESLVHDGLARGYVVRLPSRAPAMDRKLPLVLVLHGGGGNAANAEQMTGFTAKARKEGFIVVYPEGTSRFGDKLLSWNAGHCCAYAMKNDVDDVGFIRALIEKVERDYPVDPRRIHATGMSNGAMMSHRLGIELSDRIAAIAPVVGTLFGDESPPRQPVPALIINGMRDEHVPWRGGEPGGRSSRSWDGTPVKPSLHQAEFWSRANGCSAPLQRHETSLWIEWRDACASAHDVTFYLLKDNGHAWPGGEKGSRRGDEPSTAMDATDVIWTFFAAHAK